MSTTTTNYGFVKPALSDAPPDITVMNPNWDKIDTELKKKFDSDNLPTPLQIDALKRSVAFSCSATTTVLDIVNAFNDKTISYGERFSLGDYGNFNYSYGYGVLLRAVFDQTLQAYVVKILIWDDADETVGILYGKSTDGSMLLSEAEHYSLYHEGNKPTLSDIGSGTFGGAVKANTTAMATLTDTQLRNIYAGTSDLTAGSSSLTSGSIYLVYE